MIFHKVIKLLTSQSHADREAELRRNLLRREARIGGQLFGEVPKGHRREFFCLDVNTWVWHEEWQDQQGQLRAQTTRYDIRPDGVIKSQNGHYQNVNIQEVRHLRDAIRMYRQRVESDLYLPILQSVPQS